MFTTPPSLLQRLRQSPEQEAWERLVDIYTPLLVVWSRRLGLVGEDVADLVQDVFTVLVERLPGFQYDPGKSFRGWLRTVLQNRWRNQQRKQPAGKHVGSLTEDPEDLAGWCDLEEEEYRRHLASRAIELMRSDFEPTTWKAFWEVVVHDRPAAEVAAELGLSINAVYLAKGRVLRCLREELAGLLE